MSLKDDDNAAAAVQKTGNRVSLASMESLVLIEDYLNPEIAPHLTICVIVLTNGFTMVGKSAPADPQNFTPELGRRAARDDAMCQLWPFEAYRLCAQLAGLPEVQQ